MVTTPVLASQFSGGRGRHHRFDYRIWWAASHPTVVESLEPQLRWLSKGTTLISIVADGWTCWSSKSHSGVDRFPLVQHRNELLDTAGPCVGLLRILNAVEDCVPICPVERGKERSCPRVPIQRLSQVIRHRRRALSFVCRIPASVKI